MVITEQTKEFIRQHESDDIRQLALKARSYPQVDMSIAIQQIAGKQAAKHKIPLWYANENIIYPPHLSMEQCSSEATAIYKANLVVGNTIVDLTGGLGVDISFMARDRKSAVYVEMQNHLAELAKSNFSALGLSLIEVRNENGIDFLNTDSRTWDTIFIDPARRSESGRKTVLIEDCTPNLVEIDKLLNDKSQRTIIKLSPMLDITHALNSLSNITQVHIISVNNECKELLIIKEKVVSETSLTCINISQNGDQPSFSFTKESEVQADIRYTSTTEQYLYEPNASLLKAGCYKMPALHYNINKLHPNSHLYTSDRLVDDFPGRKFKINRVISPNKKEIKQYLSDISQANISTRNYPFSVAEIRKQTKLKDGGKDYIFATTLANEKKVLILCEKISDL